MTHTGLLPSVRIKNCAQQELHPDSLLSLHCIKPVLWPLAEGAWSSRAQESSPRREALKVAQGSHPLQVWEVSSAFNDTQSKISQRHSRVQGPSEWSQSPPELPPVKGPPYTGAGTRQVLEGLIVTSLMMG